MRPRSAFPVLLLKTLIVRSGDRPTVGYLPDVWQRWIDEAKIG